MTTSNENIPDILLNAKTIATVGPKDTKKRSLFGFIIQVAFYVGLGGALSNSPAGQYVVNRGLVYPAANLSYMSGNGRNGSVSNGAVWVERGAVLDTSKSARHFFLDPFTQSFLKTKKIKLLGSDGSETEKFETKTQIEPFFDFLKKQNISARDAMTVLIRFQQANTVSIMGRYDSVLLQKETTKQKNASSWLIEVWGSLGGDDKEKFNKLVKNAQKDDDVSRALRKMGDASTAWDSVMLQMLQEQATAPGLDQKSEYKTPKNLTLTEAKDFLRSAVATAGLGAVRIQQGIANEPDTLWNLGARILYANETLSGATGFSGKVLGLNNRVILSLDGFAFTATTNITEDYITISSWWDKLPHEWYHALDRTQSEYVRQWGFMPHSNMTLSDINDPKFGEMSSLGDPYKLANAQHNLWEGLSNPSLTLAERETIRKTYKKSLVNGKKEKLAEGTPDTLWEMQEKAAGSTVIKGSPWMHWTNKGSFWEQYSTLSGILRGNKAANYIGDRSENLARAAAAYIETYDLNNTDGGLALAFPQTSSGDLKFAVYDVAYTEARATKPTWDKYFQDLSGWWAEDTKRNNPEYKQISNLKTK